ncbi:hypothetical protein C8R47DRAFT_1254490 [Mycena vitilis]|nr:hypothetical protein C8R47DRAFT_1254490 [Mycena vitilis]
MSSTSYPNINIEPRGGAVSDQFGKGGLHSHAPRSAGRQRAGNRARGDTQKIPTACLSPTAVDISPPYSRESRLIYHNPSGACQIVCLGTEEEVAAAGDATRAYQRIFTIEPFLLFTNNIVTDGFFIYRSAIVWGRSARVAILPTLMVISAAVVGYLATYEDNIEGDSYIDPRVPIVMTLATNVVLVGLAAGAPWSRTIVGSCRGPDTRGPRCRIGYFDDEFAEGGVVDRPKTDLVV